MKSLEKKALDSLIEQLLSQLPKARLVGPGAPLEVLDERYLGRLKDLLHEAFPGTPDALFSAVRDDLIVVQRAEESRGELAYFEPSTLRVPRADAEDLKRWTREYADLLNVSVQRSRHLDADLKGPSLTFTEQWFSPRSFEGWAKVTLRLARTCAAWLELKGAAGLKQREVFHEDRDSHLVHAAFARVRRGEVEPLELTPL